MCTAQVKLQKASSVKSYAKAMVKACEKLGMMPICDHLGRKK